LEVKRLFSILALVEKFSHFGVDLHQSFFRAYEGHMLKKIKE